MITASTAASPAHDVDGSIADAGAGAPATASGTGGRGRGAVLAGTDR